LPYWAFITVLSLMYGQLVTKRREAVRLPVSQRPYAHTYMLEDSYLAALASGLGDGNVTSLADTQNQQRLAIIEWRTALEVAAARAGSVLPADTE
jgi:hypothetical protein